MNTEQYASPPGTHGRSLPASPPGLRLQKFLARAGVASRRAAEGMIAAGRITVNGEVVARPGVRVDPRADVVCLDGQPLALSDGQVYLMLNKPRGYLTTLDDPQGRPIVADLLPPDHLSGLFPVGRLDLDTTGLLLFTTDGELAHRLLHPSSHVAKRYIAEVDGAFSEKDAQLLRRGVRLHDGITKPAEVELLTPHPLSRQNERHFRQLKKPNTHARILRVQGQLPIVQSTVAITISEGRKRQVKRMFAHVGHPVLKLRREAFGPLQLGDLPLGEYRELTDAEVEALRSVTRRQ